MAVATAVSAAAVTENATHVLQSPWSVLGGLTRSTPSVEPGSLPSKVKGEAAISNASRASASSPDEGAKEPDLAKGGGAGAGAGTGSVGTSDFLANLPEFLRKIS